MSDEFEYGIKIVYKNGRDNDTKWFATERLRDSSLGWHNSEATVKKASPVKRKIISKKRKKSNGW